MNPNKLLAAGIPVGSAKAIAGDIGTGLTAAGSTAADAYAIAHDVNVFGTVASSTGAILPANVPAGTAVIIQNGGANALTVYPHDGGTVNGGASESLDTTTASEFRRVSSSAWIAILGA